MTGRCIYPLKTIQVYTSKHLYCENNRPTTGSGFIGPIATVIIKVTCPGNGDAASTRTWVLIGWAGTSCKENTLWSSHHVDKNNFQSDLVVCVPEQVVLDSSSSLPQSLSPSHSQRSGMQRLFLHLNLSVGQVCWSEEKRGQIKGGGGRDKGQWEGRTRHEELRCRWAKEKADILFIFWPYFGILFLAGVLFCLGREHVCTVTTDRPGQRAESFSTSRDTATLALTHTHTHTLTHTYHVLTYLQNW